MSKNEQLKYIKGTKIREQFDVASITLRRWADEGKLKFIKTPGGHHMYNIDDVSRLLGLEAKEKEKKHIAYVRAGQQCDLDKQIQYIQSKYPKHEIIKDIGSEFNSERKGLNKLVDEIISNNISELIISHKDRLSFFNFSIIEQICEKFKCKIVVLDKTDQYEKSKDLAKDILFIIDELITKYHKFKANENKRKRKAQKEESENRNKKSKKEEGEEDSSSEVQEDQNISDE